MRIFLDANVLFSAANAESRLHELIWLVIRDHEVLTSDFAQEEARRNLLNKRPSWKNDFDRLQAAIRVVGSVDRLLGVNLPEKDRPILATAIHHDCHALVTGDKRDFGHLFGRKVQGTRVLTPLALARELFT